jgi:chromosome segregation ATPase
MWEEIKGKLLDWENLVRGLQRQKEEMEKAVNPLTEQLEWVENRLAETETELDKALRLHLADNLARESLDRIIAEKQQEREGLEKTRADLLGRIEAGRISDEDIATVKDFAKKIAQGLENADFESKRRLFEILQVQGRVIQTDDGQQIKGSWLIPKQDLIVDVNSAANITARL